MIAAHENNALYTLLHIKKTKKNELFQLITD